MIPGNVKSSVLINMLTALGFKHLYSGKVRETFALPKFPDLLLIVCTDRISIFDIVLNAFVPFKGAVLNAMTIFWLIQVFTDKRTHLVAFGRGMDLYLPAELHKNINLYQRAMIVRRMEMLPVEAIVRGRLTGSGWKDYKRDGGMVCGIQLPPGLYDGAVLPQPIFTPSDKAAMGKHDTNISFERMVELVGLEKAEWVRKESLEIFTRAAEVALSRGIILADTKLEWGDALGDEIITPDSSRFWLENEANQAIAEHRTPPSLDKQPVRDWGETVDIKNHPETVPPVEVIDATTGRYLEASRRLFKKELQEFQQDDMGLAA